MQTATTAATIIRLAREARGWTPAELARRAECDEGYIGRIERGERKPTKYFVDHLLQVLADDEDAA